ncbi:hypothetical protein HAX54_000788 [Datura stramonium]|uniref:Uncharacterized protein n=1 Tax=Datura stramonium TaxID=4076 RepID=A0ABS8T1H3_DATST|nr:hypothetical protein [Datura stramonium]
MATQKAMKEEDAPSLPNNADDEDIEAGVDEEILEETFKGIILNSEGLIGWMKNELKDQQGIGGVGPAKHRSEFKASSHCPISALHLCFTGCDSIMSTSRQRGKGKTPITGTTTLGVESDVEKRIDQLFFGLNKMKNYYVQWPRSSHHPK